MFTNVHQLNAILGASYCMNLSIGSIHDLGVEKRLIFFDHDQNLGIWRFCLLLMWLSLSLRSDVWLKRSWKIPKLNGGV